MELESIWETFERSIRTTRIGLLRYDSLLLRQGDPKEICSLLRILLFETAPALAQDIIRVGVVKETVDKRFITGVYLYMEEIGSFDYGLTPTECKQPSYLYILLYTLCPITLVCVCTFSHTCIPINSSH
jgi:hypothetical protein